MDEVKRMMNLGEKVSTKHGDILVKEMPWVSIQKVLSDIAKFLQTVDLNKIEGGGDFAWLYALIRDDKIMGCMVNIVKECTDASDEIIRGLGVKDFLAVLVEVKKQNDFEEIKRLFFELVPREMFKREVLQNQIDETSEEKRESSEQLTNSSPNTLLESETLQN